MCAHRKQYFRQMSRSEVTLRERRVWRTVERVNDILACFPLGFFHCLCTRRF